MSGGLTTARKRLRWSYPDHNALRLDCLMRRVLSWREGGSMKKLIVFALAIVVSATLLPTATAGASHFPDTKCSSSGDYCVSVKKINGVRRLRLGMLFEYFPKHDVCVKGREASGRATPTALARSTGCGVLRSIGGRTTPSKGAGPTASPSAPSLVRSLL